MGGILRWMALACALGLWGCGAAFPANGACARDVDCQVCEVCGCTKAYSAADTAGASCGEIAAATLCPKGVTADCMDGPVTALCVAGTCQAVASMR